MGTGAGGGPNRAPFWPQSLGEVQQLQKTLMSPAEAAGFLHGSRDSGGSSKASSCDTDDFVMVPAQFAGQLSPATLGQNIEGVPSSLWPWSLPLRGFQEGMG